MSGRPSRVRRRELLNDGLVAAQQTITLDAPLQRGQAEVLKPSDLLLGECLLGDVL